MKLTKHHGLGNDFLIAWVDAIPDGASAFAREICDRHTGIGADGLILGVGSHPVEFRLFNSDGSAAEVSGNGLRCFGQALAMAEGVDVLDVTVGTAAGPREIRVIGPSGEPGESDVEVDMGVARPGPTLDGRDPGRHLPVLAAATVDMGNPHVVLHVDDPMAYDMTKIGPSIEADFKPTGVNVHLVDRAEARIRMNIWERGAGATQACGSGACAVAVAAQGWGWAPDGTVVIEMPGGTARVTVDRTVRLRGPAVFVGTVKVPFPIVSTRTEAPHG